MDAFFHSGFASWVIFILAITNVILGIRVFLSCRCMPGYKFARGLMHNKSYLRFYKFHGYLWLIFLVSALTHAVFAI